MRSTMVRVPVALLDNNLLGKSAKVLWMALQLAGGGVGRRAGAGGGVGAVPRTGLLQASSGLARHTVLRALAQLRAAGWLPGPGPAAATNPANAAPQVRIPAELLPDRRVNAQAKLLYAGLARLNGPRSPRGECTLAQLCQQTGASPNTVKRALRALQATGWLEFSQRNKFSPIEFLLGNPVAAWQRESVARVEERLQKGSRGEALMRAYLSLLVESDEHDYDASPAFLVNPFTGQEMQFDRYYPVAGVAFEFQGPQHFGPTKHFPDEQKALKQQARDYMKRLICARRGIRLVAVHAGDLTLERMRQKVEGHLPLRDLAGHEAVLAYLERISGGYRCNAVAESQHSA